MESIRQQRKLTRASQRDKWGFSMALSRKQRRSLRIQSQAASYMKGSTTITLNIGEIIQHPESGFFQYGGGTRKCY